MNLKKSLKIPPPQGLVKIRQKPSHVPLPAFLPDVMSPPTPLPNAYVTEQKAWPRDAHHFSIKRETSFFATPLLLPFP